MGKQGTGAHIAPPHLFGLLRGLLVELNIPTHTSKHTTHVSNSEILFNRPTWVLRVPIMGISAPAPNTVFP